MFDIDDADDEDELEQESFGKLCADEDKCKNLDLFFLWNSFGRLEFDGVSNGDIFVDKDLSATVHLGLTSIVKELGLPGSF